MQVSFVQQKLNENGSKKTRNDNKIDDTNTELIYDTN